LQAAVPIFIYLMFFAFSWAAVMELLVAYVILNFITKVLPTAWKIGVSEVAFILLFATLFTSGTLFWALLFWRLVDTYFYILKGFGTSALFVVTNKIKTKLKNKNINS
jgi:hypothetical protein